jgi:hypothetical protein
MAKKGNNLNNVNSPYLYRVRIEGIPGRLYDLHLNTDKLVAAHKKSDKGLRFATYSVYAGPGPSFDLIVPLGSLGDLDGLSENHEVMVDAYGEEEGRRSLKEWGETINSFETSILKQLPEHSTLSNKAGANYPPYLYHLVIKGIPGRLYELDETSQRLADAHRKVNDGLQFALYAVYAGPGTQYEFFIPSNDLAGLDSWADNDQVVVKAFGEQGRQILRNWGESIASFRSEILQLEESQSI